jgi:hypothetical protein
MISSQAFPITFAKGLDTKTDPKQVQAGNFLKLENSIFDKGGLLQKRNGFGQLTTLPNANSTYLTTFSGNLTAIGNQITAYNANNEAWVTKGTIQPMEVGVLPLIRNNLNQTQSDVAIINNLACTAYIQTSTSISATTTQYLYSISDATTGQTLIEPSAIPVISGGTISGPSRVFAVNNFFVVISPVTVSSSVFLQYFTVLATNLGLISAAQNVTSEVYVPHVSQPGWDAVYVASKNKLLVAYNTTTGAQGVHVAALTSTQIALNQETTGIKAFSNTAYLAAILSICLDTTVSPNIAYITFWNSSTNDSYTCAVFINGAGIVTAQFNPQMIYSSVSIVNFASAAQNGSCSVFGEVLNSYSYDSSILTDYVNSIPVSQAGTVGSSHVVIRSVGLASKAFIVNGTIYFLSNYQSPFQPTYFLINGSLSTSANPVISGKLAYENGSKGYTITGLPNVTTNGNVVQFPYLFRDLITALSTVQNTAQTTTGGIYSQTGVNLATLTIGTTNIDSSEIGSNLHLSGGFLSMYDGHIPVEHDFFLWPDSVEVTYNDTSTVTPTGTVASGSNVVTAVSAITGVFPGMTITGTAIPSGTTIVFVGTTTITMSAAATGNHSSETLTIQGNIVDQPPGYVSSTPTYFWQAVYKWADGQGNQFFSATSVPVSVTPSGSTSVGSATINIPTLRLTYKTANPVTIHVYRWSVANQVYYEVTNVLAPILNDTTVDFVTFVDTLPDADIIGNNIIYTTGGVVEDVNAPASNLMTLADSRLWLVDAEDPNLLWFSKQVIEGTPVEMSDLLTMYIPPTTAAQGTTGPVSALAPMDGNLILFKKNAIYYVNLSAGGPDNTGANSQYSQPIFITSTIGCANQQSIVFTPAGLMFQSEQGIWLLDRNLQASYIGAPVQAFNGSQVESAINIPGTNEVRFTLSTGETLMYDYYYGQWGTFVGAPGISSCIYNNLHTVLNAQGQVSQETPGIYLDGSNPVLMSFLSAYIQLQGISGYQALFEIQLLGQYFSPHLLNFQLGYDFGALSEQALIDPTNFTGVYGSDSLYGQTSPYGGPGSLEQWRIQPSTQNCQSFQISLQEVYDPSLGVQAGAGFTLSAMTCVLGVNRSYRPVKAANTIGTSS